ncbi:MAG: inositol monophosphatase family protein [Candidatus Thorarchaeota archaeon]|nr:inositol monophosphatase family protein [Candidatus Thorarchaeota archaeon]
MVTGLICPEEKQEYLDFARTVSEKAGKITLNHFKKLTNIEMKSDDTPVTIADRQSEEFIRTQIQDKYPSHSIIGEEFKEKHTDSEFRWIIDPIDGTQSFIRGVPFYAVLLALEHQGRPIVGVIHIPPLNETVSAAKGVGCYYNGNPCQVGKTETLSKAWVQVTDCADLKRRRPGFTDRLLEKSYSCRTWGDAYGYLLVATGRVDAMIDPIMALWDIAPLEPIITEAGGIFTDLDGNPNVMGESSLATNKKLHKEILELL